MLHKKQCAASKVAVSAFIGMMFPAEMQRQIEEQGFSVFVDLVDSKEGRAILSIIETRRLYVTKQGYLVLRQVIARGDAGRDELLQIMEHCAGLLSIPLVRLSPEYILGERMPVARIAELAEANA